MEQLQVINQDGQLLVNSRDVAEMVGKLHKHLLDDIRKYVEILDGRNLGSQNFFAPSTYINSQNKQQPCYLLTRKGCDMVANKLTGEKGVVFTATYVTQFERMAAEIQQQAKSPAELIYMLAQQNMESERRMVQLEQQVTTVNHRLDNIDRIDTIGDLQQRLNKMIRRHAQQEKMTIPNAWRAFTDAFNTAYKTNLKLRITKYKEKHGLKDLTRPQYLSMTNQLEDAVRVADKLLNKGSATA